MKIRKISQIEPNMSKVIGINDIANDKDVYSSITINELIDDKIKSKSKIIWTNPKPTSNFSTQAINLDEFINECDSYEIIYKGWRGNNHRVSTGIIPKSSGCLMQYLESTSICGIRTTTGISNNQITINDTKGTNVDNAFLIPEYIIAHNRGLF